MNNERAVIYAILNPSGVIVYIGSTVNYSNLFGTDSGAGSATDTYGTLYCQGIPQ